MSHAAVCLLILSFAAAEPPSPEAADAVGPAAAADVLQDGGLPPVGSVVDVDVLVVETDDRIEELDKLLKDNTSFEKGSELALPTAAGVLAVIGQAIARHPDRSKAGFSGTALRDAALKLAESGSLEDAQKALVGVQAARGGGGDGGAVDDAAWYDLIPSYELMEEINTRNSRLVRVSRRPRGKPEEAAHAAVIALLCYPMHAQGEDYVLDDADLPDYRGLVIKYQREVADLGRAVRAKNGAEVKRLLLASKETCDHCHKVYRDGE